MRHQISDIQTTLTANKTTSNVNAKWIEWLKPFIWIGFGAGGFLILQHGSELVQLLIK